MLKIGDFSKLSRLSIRMLRHYDELGLLTPRSTDNLTAYRYYSADQLPEAARIVALREMGFGLAAIAEILKCYEDPQALAEFLTVQQAETRAEVENASRRLRLLETAIQRLRKDETAMHYNVTVKTMPERYVASVRSVVPAYDQEGVLWETLGRETAPLHVQYADNCNSLTIFHDDGYLESDVDLEVQLSVKGTYPNTEHVIFKTEPALEVASITYQGSYEQMPAVNQAMATWVQDNGYEFSGKMFCIYHVSPVETKDPAELVTEVCYSVKKI